VNGIDAGRFCKLYAIDDEGQRMKKKIFCILTVLCSLLLILTGAEILLRISGAKPWPILASNEPAMLQQDPILGWKTKPGKYRLPPFSPQGKETHYAFLEDGSRVTSDNQKMDSYDLIFLGCSFTLGFAVSDSDTFAWKLQATYPSLRMGNFGVPGYSTYQSLLLLRELYKRNIKPAIVIYGFVILHEERNIAASNWRILLSKYSKRGHVLLPYCTLDKNGKLIEHEPIGYPLLPLRHQLALTGDFAANCYFKFWDTEESERREQSSEVTQNLMTEMNSLAQKNGSSFFIAMLDPYGNYESFFKTTAIAKIDCRIPFYAREYMVQGDGHPNEKAHSIYAGKIARSLLDQPAFQALF
jgi:hypothetical protein